MSEALTVDHLERIATATLDGEYTSERRGRFADLPDAADDITPIELFETWEGGTPTTRASAASASASNTDGGFDPATDQRNNNVKNKAARAYHKAREHGHQELAAYIRSMGLSKQKDLADLLDAAFDFETGEWDVEDLADQRDRRVPRMGGL